MAKPEHLEILKKGVAAWNAWRLTAPMETPDLSAADLEDADLHGANLEDADMFTARLSKVNLHSANLENADLRNADLSMAVLTNAKLQEAGLGEANLRRADLCGAMLQGAGLQGANLSEAALAGADLSKTFLYQTVFNHTVLSHVSLADAELGMTTFAFTSLKTVKGLETCKHQGPSSLDYYTLRNSGRLPQEFLRGCGLPDDFIENLSSFWKTASEFYSCFISYSSKDDEFVQRLYADLQSKGIRCWFAPEDLKIGEKFRVKIDEAIRVYDKLLLVLSEHSVQSEWVEKEVETAFEKERQQKRLVLFPIRLDDAVMKTEAGWAADIRRTRHIGDFCKWKDHAEYTKALERLLRDLKSDKAEPDANQAASSPVHSDPPSEQAVSILRQFVDSGAGTLIYRDWGGGQFSLSPVVSKAA
jgi:hypothetical protein